MNWLTVISLCNIRKDTVSTSYTIWALEMELTTDRWCSHKPGVKPNLPSRGYQRYSVVCCQGSHTTNHLFSTTRIPSTPDTGCDARQTQRPSPLQPGGKHHVATNLNLAYSQVHCKLRRPSLSSRRCTNLEQSSAAYHICSVTSCRLDVQHSVTVSSQWLRHVRGTACRRLSGMNRRWRRSVTSWRLYFSGRRLTMTRRSWLYCTV